MLCSSQPHRPISRPLAALIGHRGVTHSVLAVVACLVLLRWQGYGRGVADPLVIGYLSHLAADLLTSSGLRLVWPLRQRQAIPLYRTGSLSESIIVTGVTVYVLGCFGLYFLKSMTCLSRSSCS